MHRRSLKAHKKRDDDDTEDESAASGDGNLLLEDVFDIYNVDFNFVRSWEQVSHCPRCYSDPAARDLYKFAASFNHSTHGDMLVVPANFIDRWIEKFEAKCRVDPGFMMKNDD